MAIAWRIVADSKGSRITKIPTALSDAPDLGCAACAGPTHLPLECEYPGCLCDTKEDDDAGDTD